MRSARTMHSRLRRRRRERSVTFAFPYRINHHLSSTNSEDHTYVYVYHHKHLHVYIYKKYLYYFALYCFFYDIFHALCNKLSETLFIISYSSSQYITFSSRLSFLLLLRDSKRSLSGHTRLNAGKTTRSVEEYYFPLSRENESRALAKCLS